jgi:hypothetical protein
MYMYVYIYIHVVCDCDSGLYIHVLLEELCLQFVLKILAKNIYNIL